MNVYEILSITIASLAFFISIASIIINNKNASATIELTINDRITATKEKVSNVSVLMAPFLAKKTKSATDKVMIETYAKQFDLAIENNLNAYEEACAKFLDKKVDRNRFKKIYIAEIRQLVENAELKKYFDAVSSRYRAILKVYNEWENHEK